MRRRVDKSQNCYALRERRQIHAPKHLHDLYGYVGIGCAKAGSRAEATRHNGGGVGWELAEAEVWLRDGEGKAGVTTAAVHIRQVSCAIGA